MMKWDKTPLGYLLWALYTIAAGAALFLTGESFGGTLGITGMESYLAGGIALAFSLLVFAILRLVLRSGKGKKNRKGREKRNVWKQTGSEVGGQPKDSWKSCSGGYYILRIFNRRNFDAAFLASLCRRGGCLF